MFCIRVLFSYPKLFAKFPVLARSDFRLSWRTLPTVISTRRYSIVKEHLICGGSYQICGIHYGGSIQITNDSFIPSSSSHCECSKGAMIWRISKNTLTYPKEKIGVLTTSNCDLLQFVYRIYPRITLTVAVLFIYPLNW